jgi:hypothetical protein
MADPNYTYPILPVGAAPAFGSFWAYMKFDAKVAIDRLLPSMVTQEIAASSDFKLMKIKDLWVIRESYIRVKTAADATVTYNVGTTEAGTEIAAAVDATTPGDWVAGTITLAAKEIMSADSYIWLMIDTAAVTKGVLEIMVEFAAGPLDGAVG